MQEGGYRLLLMRGPGRRNKQQPVEPTAVEHMTGQIEMPLMNGVKGPTEQADREPFSGSGHV